MIVYSLLGVGAGAALMLVFREMEVGLLLVPFCVAIGPGLLAWRRISPSRVFFFLYILLSGLLFMQMALTGPGFRFDPP